jgi:hypothetical protein
MVTVSFPKDSDLCLTQSWVLTSARPRPRPIAFDLTGAEVAFTSRLYPLLTP